MELDRIEQAEFFDLCNSLPDDSVDMVLCDLPYGTTACEWDTRIPLEPMWDAFKRVVKGNAPIVLTASQPFTSMLVMSNLDWFRYEWVWEKPQGTGYLNANRQPMKNHENVMVFSCNAHAYYPQFTEGKAYSATSGAVGGFVRDKTVGGYLTVNSGSRYPLSIIPIDTEKGYHPTQKPVALFEYLIKTYTQPGAVVFDPCVGSGTTAIAAKKTGRHYICGDMSEDYVSIARQRVQNSDPYQDTIIDETTTQLSLFKEG